MTPAQTLIETTRAAWQPLTDSEIIKYVEANRIPLSQASQSYPHLFGETHE
jgi:hypothetical protein